MAKKATSARTKRRSGSRARSGSQNTTGSAQLESSIEKALTAYCDFVEKSAPQVKQAMDDAYTVWLDVTKATVGLEETLLDKMGVDTQPFKDAVKVFQKTTSVALESQRLATAAASETSVKVADLVRRAVKGKQ